MFFRVSTTRKLTKLIFLRNFVGKWRYLYSVHPYKQKYFDSEFFTFWSKIFKEICKFYDFLPKYKEVVIKVNIESKSGYIKETNSKMLKRCQILQFTRGLKTKVSKIEGQNVRIRSKKSNAWISTIGLEVHAQLQTKTKLFSR